MTGLPRRVLALLMLFAVAACSSNSSRDIDYQNSAVTPTLEMPPNIIQAETDRNLALPGSTIGTRKSGGRFVETGYLNQPGRVLPELSELRVEGQGDLYWLSVQLPAERLYPRLREFWLQEGYTLHADEPIAGLLRTDWIGSKSGSESSFFTRLLQRLRSAESKHQYITRLERGADAGQSRVFIAHRQQQLVLVESETSATDEVDQGWQFSVPDPAREREMLYRLMLFLGADQDLAKAELERIGTFVPRASIVAAEDEETNAYLAVKQSYQRTRNRILHWLTRRDVAIDERGNGGRGGEISFNADAFVNAFAPADASITRQRIRLSLQGHGNADVTRIEVIDANGSVDRSAEAERIYRSLLPLLI